MACSCGCNPCSCTPSPSICCTPTTESVEYTFENANLVGIGFFDNDTDNLVQFRGAVSNSAALTITLDAANNVLVFDFDDEALVLDIPDATTTQRGILETATNAEALAKAATDKIVTPSNFAAMGSTTTFAGLLELATDAETITGTSTTLAVTPAGLAAANGLSGTTTFADAVARAAKVPAFEGQFGGQLDTNTAWIASGALAGNWSSLITGGQVSDLTAADTQVLGTGRNFDFLNFNAVQFPNSTVSFETAVVADASGVVIPAASVVITDPLSPDGTISSQLISTFLSTANPQTGWGTPSGTLARTTFATYAGQTITNPPTQAEVQAIDDALVIVSRRLGALITDLKAVLLPAT